MAERGWCAAFEWRFRWFPCLPLRDDNRTIGNKTIENRVIKRRTIERGKGGTVLLTQRHEDTKRTGMRGYSNHRTSRGLTCWVNRKERRDSRI